MDSRSRIEGWEESPGNLVLNQRLSEEIYGRFCAESRGSGGEEWEGKKYHRR